MPFGFPGDIFEMCSPTKQQTHLQDRVKGDGPLHVQNQVEKTCYFRSLRDNSIYLSPICSGRGVLCYYGYLAGTSP